jgi:membrane protease YdiL (CAAX protease family)
MNESRAADKPERNRMWPEPAWNFWQALFLLLIIYLLQFALGWTGPSPYPAERSGAVEYLIRGFGSALIALALLSVFLRLKGQPPSALGLNRMRGGHVLRGFGAGAALFLLAGTLGGFIAWLFGEPAAQGFALAVEGSDTWGQLTALVLLGVIIVPLQEELIFRGLIYPPLRKVYGPTGGIARNSLFFALIHFDAPRFVPILAGGFLLCLLFERNRSIWPSVIAHGVWNGLMVIFVVITRDFR